MVTDQVGRLSGYTHAELRAYRHSQLNSLPFGITRAFAAARTAAASRGTKIERAQNDIERVDLVAYSALEVAVNNLEEAANKLAASFE